VKRRIKKSGATLPTSEALGFYFFLDDFLPDFLADFLAFFAAMALLPPFCRHQM
jgi:hypothetical protein